MVCVTVQIPSFASLQSILREVETLEEELDRRSGEAQRQNTRASTRRRKRLQGSDTRVKERNP